jgi:transcriptional regulator with XRE-family HTH domain
MTDKEFLFELGINIKVARMRKRINTMELADLCKMNKTSINDIELGKVSTRITTLRKIAAATDIDIKSLLP